MKMFGSSGASTTEMASTSGFDDEMLMDYRRHQENGNLMNCSNEVGDQLSEIQRGEMVSFQAYKRSKSSLCSKKYRGFNVNKPLNPLDSFLRAPLYTQHVGTEEYMFSPCSSPSIRTVRPLLVTDGSRIISRAITDSYNVQFESGESKLHQDNGYYEKEIALGIRPVPLIDPLERKLKQKRGEGQCRRLSCSKTKVSGEQFVSQGLSGGMFVFYLGITIGMMLKQSEVDKLVEMLKQKEKLVQDQQEELEMKDSVTVKELANEDYDSQETNDRSFHNRVPTSFSSEQELESLHYDSKRPDYPKPEENSEFMSQIEAELVAELELLELNMNTSSLETAMSDFVELDPDLVGNVVQGELRSDIVNNAAGIETDSDRDASGASTAQTQNLNYAVSAQELRSKLQEVVIARLEERNMELESELQNSQKRVNLLESKRRNLPRDFPNSDLGSSSQESPTMTGGGNTASLPLFLNLSEDALDAYNEVYDEFMGISGTDDEDTPIPKQGLHPLNKNLFPSRNGGEENEFLPRYEMLEEERELRTLLCDKNGTWERFSRSRGSSEVGEFENGKENEDSGNDDDDDDDDEMGKLLIKQILEKARQGSPVVLNAQRMLLSMDENL